MFPDATAMQAEVASPLYRGGLWLKDAGGVLDPAKLAVGLLAAALRAGVRVHEHSPALALDDAPQGDRTLVRTRDGAVNARRVLLATSAFPPLLRAIRRYVVPVYDYALMTEPLTAEQRRAIRWQRRQGIGDGGNQFHYYRLSADDRILWGGYDAVYRFRGPVRDDLDDHDATFGRLAQNFFATFPELEGLRFGHRWGGAIDTCSRFSVFFGTARHGRVAYATGYTGLGVAATRWGARVALDLVDGRDTEATRSRYVRRKPVPFPPEPLRTAVIQLTRNRLAAADRRDGRRGPLARRARPARARLQQLRLSAEAAGRPSCRRAGGRSSTRPSRSGRSSWTAGPAPFARSARCRGRRRARSRRCRPACPARP